MSRSRISVWGACVLGVVWLTATAAVAQPFELTVKNDRLFGASDGTLVFTPQGVDYQTADVEEARRWVYDDIKQILILSSTHVVIATYEDQGWIKLGADKRFDFEVIGEPVSEDLVTFLLDRVHHPLVTGVVPTLDGAPHVRLPRQVAPALSREPRHAGVVGRPPGVSDGPGRSQPCLATL